MSNLQGAVLNLQGCKINDYKSIIGAILFLNLFPISVWSIFEFYKAKKIDYTMGWILLITLLIGTYMTSKYIVIGENKLSNKTIKYITAYFSLITGALFLISAIYEKN